MCCEKINLTIFLWSMHVLLLCREKGAHDVQTLHCYGQATLIVCGRTSQTGRVALCVVLGWIKCHFFSRLFPENLRSHENAFAAVACRVQTDMRYSHMLGLLWHTRAVGFCVYFTRTAFITNSTRWLETIRWCSFVVRICMLFFLSLQR